MNTQPEPPRMPRLSMFDCDRAIELVAFAKKTLHGKGATEMIALEVTTEDLLSADRCVPRYFDSAPRPGDKLLGVTIDALIVTHERPGASDASVASLLEVQAPEDICVTHTLRTEDGQAVFRFLGTEGTQQIPFDPVPACPAGKSLHWFIDDLPDSPVIVSVHLAMFSYWESGQS